VSSETQTFSLLDWREARSYCAMLFDHLVGGGRERRRHREAERPRGLAID
jgi:hypothetical protein